MSKDSRREPYVEEDSIDVTRLGEIEVPQYENLTSFQLNELRRVVYRYPDSHAVSITTWGALLVNVGRASEGVQILIPPDPPAGVEGLALIRTRTTRAAA